MKFLIIPGFAKSGTTFLYEQLAKSGAPINLPKRKEVDYFRNGKSLEGYLAQFKTTDPDKVFLDASPLYGLPNSNTAATIKKVLKKHDVKFVFCLRESLSRAYSHYMHDISTHFFLYAHAPYSFYSPATLKKYFSPLAPVVQDYVKIFGQENVSGFGFKSTGPKLRADVLKFLTLPASYKLDFSVNPAVGSSIPRIFYDSERELTVRSGKEFYALPPRTFLLANIRYQQYRTDFPSRIAHLLLNNSTSWDRQFDPSVLGASLKPILKDYLRCFEALDMDHEILENPKMIYAKEPPAFSREICDKMEKVGQVPATVVDMFQGASRKKKLFQAQGDVDPNVATDRFLTIPEAMDEVESSHGKSNGQRIKSYQAALRELGPVPQYVKGYLRHLIQIGEGGEVLSYLQQNPNLQRYISFKVVLEDLKSNAQFFSREEYSSMRKLMGMGGTPDE